jgi:phage terminase large subunit-like protein
MVGNAVVKKDPAGNIKPDKEKASDKIDGVVAAVMALGRSMVQGAPERSVYETRGILSLD